MKDSNDHHDIEVIEKDSIDADKFDRQKRIHGWDQSKISNAKVMVIPTDEELMIARETAQAIAKLKKGRISHR